MQASVSLCKACENKHICSHAVVACLTMASARKVVNDTGAKSAGTNASGFAVVSGLDEKSAEATSSSSTVVSEVGEKNAEANSSACTVINEVGEKSAEANASADTEGWWEKDADMTAESKALWVAHYKWGKEKQRKEEDALRRGKGMSGVRARTAQFVNK